MTTGRRPHFILTVAFLLAVAAASLAQQSGAPHIGYVYPAGGRAGTTFQVKVGGQYLNGVAAAVVSGEGVRAEIIGFARPLTPQQVNQLRQQLKELQEKRAAARNGETNRAGWTTADLKKAAEIRSKIAQSQKRSINPAIADTVTIKMTLASNAEAGERELRLQTPLALSEPLIFCVGRLAEFNKPVITDEEPPGAFRRRADNVQKAAPPVEAHVMLPCVVNGQILPGGVDRYRFYARTGQRLVIAVSARQLMPYLADAVPGWFQAALSLYDPRGHEVTFADHFRFHPDPVIFYEAPADGEYVMQIRDSIYRGREDFVYRITAGELPFITGIFPLGGPAGAVTTVKLTGWNLPVDEVSEGGRGFSPGIYPISVQSDRHVSNPLPFAADTLPECVSAGGNHSQATAQTVSLPVIINGKVAQAGQWNVFRFAGQAGDVIVAEVMARRLESPLDSILKLTDETGRQLAFNDDFEDKGAGLQTQYADSYLRVTLPETASYYLYIGDAQQQGGPEYAYRLRLGPPRPDFALRVAPSSLTVRAGMAAQLTAYALRYDGFSNEITLAFQGAPEGFSLSGAVVPANQNEARFTVTAPAGAASGLFKITMEGVATIAGREVIRPGVPAQDMMQAFAYWHLVPSQDFEVSILDRPVFRFALKILDAVPIKIPAGGFASVRVRTPGRATNDNLRLELNEPPEGLSITKLSRSDGETTIVLHSDASKIKPGASGNLIVNLVASRARANAGAGKRRGNPQGFVIGTLPAIPFEVVPPALLAR